MVYNWFRAIYDSRLMVKGSWLYIMAEKKTYYKYSKKGESKPKTEYKPKRGPLSKLMSEEVFMVHC